MRKSVQFLILLAIGLPAFYACNQVETVDLKLMSYNIRHGEGNDLLVDLSRAAAIIEAQEPELCGLQEIDEYCLRSDSIGQTGYLARETQMTGTFGKFMDFQSGAYGMATLSALPLVSTRVLDLPDGKYEPRSTLVHEVQIAGKDTIVFANVHFDWISGEEGSINRLKQAKALVNYIDELGQASIITGDFNCTPDSPTMQYFERQGFHFVDKGEDNLSFQGSPKVEIDHVIFRNAGKVKFNERKAILLEEPLVSDHRPLVVEIEVLLN